MIPSSSNRSIVFREKALQKGYDETTVSFLEQVINNYPKLKFRIGAKFAFRPPRTIVIGPREDRYDLLLLHEVSHALCGHHDFTLDVERLKMEAEAWEKARELASSYDVDIDEGAIQSELDTYRDWLHKKSRCPKCGLTRFQTPDAVYHCPLCERFKTDKK